jgi:hypothetical protein
MPMLDPDIHCMNRSVGGAAWLELSSSQPEVSLDQAVDAVPLTEEEATLPSSSEFDNSLADDGIWSPAQGWQLRLRPDTAGVYAVDSLDGLPSADINPAAPGSVLPPSTVALSPTAHPYGPFAQEGVIAIKFYVCPDGLEDQLVEFEQETQSIYYPFMARVGWRYGGLCRIRSSVTSIFSTLRRDLFDSGSRPRCCGGA